MAWRAWRWIGSGGILLLVGGVVWWQWFVVHWVVRQPPGCGCEVAVPADWPERLLAAADRAAGFMLQAERADGAARVSLRRESGLGVMRLRGGSLRELLLEAIEQRYPDRFPEHRREGAVETTVGNERAMQYTFTYRGQDQSTRIRQRLTVVLQGETAWLLAVQSPVAEFERFEPVFTTIQSRFRLLADEGHP